MRFRFFAVGCVLVLLAGCRDSSLPELPKGEQTLRGVIRGAELSLTRRGTHLFTVAGRDAYYLESSSVKLRDAEGSTATLKGTLEHNTNPRDLPVLIVTEILEQEDAMKPWTLPSSFGIALNLPSEWKGVATDTEATFTASGASTPLLTISLNDLGNVSFSFSSSGSEDNTESIPIVIASKRAIRIRDTVSGAETVHIDRGVSTQADQKRVITLAFAMDPEDLKSSNELILEILQSIRFTGEKRSSQGSAFSSSKAGNAASDGTSSAATGAGQPCGGPAGILCPAGFYCDVEDLQTNIGHCKKM